MSTNPITVRNLANDAELTYAGITPRQAVIAAYAKETANNGNTWEYEQRYGHLVKAGKRTLSIGDWCVIA